MAASVFPVFKVKNGIRPGFFILTILLTLLVPSPAIQSLFSESSKKVDGSLLFKVANSIQKYLPNFEVDVTLVGTPSRGVKESEKKSGKNKARQSKPIHLHIQMMLPEGIVIETTLPSIGKVRAGYLKDKYCWAQLLGRMELYKLDIQKLNELVKNDPDKKAKSKNLFKKLSGIFEQLKRANVLNSVKKGNYYHCAVPLGGTGDANLKLVIHSKRYLPESMRFFSTGKLPVGSLIFKNWKRGHLKRDIFKIPVTKTGKVNEFNPLLYFILIDKFGAHLSSPGSGF